MAGKANIVSLHFGRGLFFPILFFEGSRPQSNAVRHCLRMNRACGLVERIALFLLSFHIGLASPHSVPHPHHRSTPRQSSRAVAGFGIATSSINRDSTTLPRPRYEWHVSPGANPPDVALQTLPLVLAVTVCCSIQVCTASQRACTRHAESPPVRTKAPSGSVRFRRSAKIN